MEALEAIFTRRSVRAYGEEAVSDESVESLLRAAMAAPSAGNQQPWQFVVVRDQRQRGAVASASPHGGMIAGAPVTVVVCADMHRVRHDGFWVQDCAAATQNLLLAAHALGLGAVWVGTYPRDERVQAIRQVLGLPDHLIPFAAVPVGYPCESPRPAERFEGERVHTDRYADGQ